MPANLEVAKVARLSQNCVRFASSMGNLVALGYDWSSVEAVCRMAGVKTSRPLVEKLLAFENIYMKYLNKKDGGYNGGS